MITVSGPESGPVLVVFAPGDCGRLADAAPTTIAAALVRHGVRVARFAAPVGDLNDSTTQDAAVAELMRQAARQRGPGQRLWLAGQSRGARVALALADELNADGVLAFGFPFHPRDNTDASPRLASLRAFTRPMWLAQGTRDSHGNLQQVRGYNLTNVQVHWLEDANHALHPRPRSGHTQAAQLTAAVAAAVAFMRAHSR